DPPYVLVSYLDRMELAYAAAYLVLCRSGANTCAELTAVGLPAAYVPLPHGNGEQRLLADPARLEAMSKAASTLGHRDADVALARLVLDLAGAPAESGAGTGSAG